MVSSPAPSGYVYVGCYPDSVVRLLDGASVAMSNLTIAACANYCNTISSTRFYPLIGVEDKDQCFCGTNFTRDPGTANEFGCNDPCNGNANLTCGGQGYINVYNATSVPAGLNPLPVPTTTTSSVLGGITIIPVDTAPAISTTPTPSPTPIPSTKPSRALVALSISAGVLMAFLLAALGWWYLSARRKRKSNASVVSSTLVGDNTEYASQHEMNFRVKSPIPSMGYTEVPYIAPRTSSFQ